MLLLTKPLEAFEFENSGLNFPMTDIQACTWDRVRIYFLREFRPKWRHRQKHFTSSYNQKKGNNQFKSKEQPELPKNPLHGSTTTKELKKHSSTLGGEAKAGTRIIRMLTELVELSCKMKEEMKTTQSEIKENIQGTNSERKESGTQ